MLIREPQEQQICRRLRRERATHDMSQPLNQ